MPRSASRSASCRTTNWRNCAPSCRSNSLLAVRLPDPHAELLGRAQRAAARLAVDREHRREARIAGRTARPQLAPALRALRGQLPLPLLEVALREPAAEADGDPVAPRLAPLLPEPVRGLAHAGEVRGSM